MSGELDSGLAMRFLGWKQVYLKPNYRTPASIWPFPSCTSFFAYGISNDPSTEPNNRTSWRFSGMLLAPVVWILTIIICYFFVAQTWWFPEPISQHAVTY